jgi:glycosyltransferase involved in cell wall biosynthesis
MHSPIVSVLMTTYNRALLTATAIESVLASDFGDFELIICDDGSTDDTLEVCKRYAASDKRIRVYQNPENLGDYPNRNKVSSYAVGKYLKYLDSDDYIYPWALGCMVLMMEKFPDAGWGLCSMEPDQSRIFPFQLEAPDIYRLHYFGSGVFQRAPLSSIIRRDVFENMDGFRPFRMIGDFDMWHRLAMHYPLVLMPQGMVWYRRHTDQEMASYDKYLPDYERIKLEHLLSSQCPLTPDEIRTVLQSEKNRILRRLFSSLFRFRLTDLLTSYRMLKPYFSISK